MSLAAQQVNPTGIGCVDIIAYCSPLGLWLVCGWIGRAWTNTADELRCRIVFDGREQEADGTICFFPRPDVEEFGLGCVLAIEAPPSRQRPAEIEVHGGTVDFRLEISDQTQFTNEADAIRQFKAGLAHAVPEMRRARMLKWVSRPLYQGQDSLAQLLSPLFIEVDHAYLCPPDGLLVKGWFADPFSQLKTLRLRSGPRATKIDRSRWIAIRRPDVLAALGPRTGLSDENCGFLAFAPHAYTPGEVCYFEVETISGETGFHPMPLPRAAGIGTMKDMLSEFDLRYHALSVGYDSVIGPAISALNRSRLEDRPNVTAISFGTLPAQVRCSILVPLFRRIDFMEYQLAFLSQTLQTDHEIIYVLDDPSQTAAAERLAASCLARFHRPFTLLFYDRNLGFAPANNIALGYARGDYVCFLNSDVFPKEPGWLEFMLETAANPEIGVTGALLLFEDDSVQHEGLAFERLPEFDNWVFCTHPRKGLACRNEMTVKRVPAVTGACMVMRTPLARAVGGFDEAYAIGDFEDVDLCLKLRERGLSCAVDHRAQLYHLERQSQGGAEAAWRMNLTLFNAWQFQQRWKTQLELAVPEGAAA